eukprot:5059390-Prymnesium_polylepis.1
MAPALLWQSSVPRPTGSCPSPREERQVHAGRRATATRAPVLLEAGSVPATARGRKQPRSGSNLWEQVHHRPSVLRAHSQVLVYGGACTRDN